MTDPIAQARQCYAEELRFTAKLASRAVIDAFAAIRIDGTVALVISIDDRFVGAREGIVAIAMVPDGRKTGTRFCDTIEFFIKCRHVKLMIGLKCRYDIGRGVGKTCPFGRTFAQSNVLAARNLRAHPFVWLDGNDVSISS